MIILREISALRSELRVRRQAGRRIGFVPTMGALHDGHLSLVENARSKSDCVVVSIFVNPTQFAPNEDFRRYPRTPERDCELLDATGTDIVFMPEADVMYPATAAVTVNPGPVADTFEGAVRPDHFRGVLTVVAKLLNLVLPDVAVFGQKDAQQLFLIRRMVADLNFPVEIIESPTRRDADGLAQSSRNVYLNESERNKATILFRALNAGEAALRSGSRSLRSVQLAMQGVCLSEPDFTPNYATVVSEQDFLELDPIPETCRLLIAGRLGPVRLIDNFRIDSSDKLEPASEVNR